jgi:ankyrin repeat protein
MDAIELKHADVAQCLIQHGAMLDLQGDAYEILIRKAVTTNDVATTAVLLKAAATFTKKAEVYGSLLHVAIPLKSDGIVELLIKAGADVNHIDSAGQTPLHIAVGAAKSEASMIRLLLSSHPDLNRQSEAGNTPLHSFFKDENRNLEVLELILQSRTNVNCKNSEEDTALHLAVKDGASRISEVRRLLSSGADPNVSDANQRGALHRLVLSGKADTAILDAVLRANANVTSRDKEGFTPLAIAVQIAACSDAVITQLAEAGSDLSAIDEQGRSISLHAVRRGRDKVVDHMLQKANSIILRPSGNELLLHAATEYGHYSIAKKLLEAGLSTSSRDSEGCQATFTAIRVRSNGYIPGLRKSSMLGLREQSGIAEPRKVATSEADDIALISTLLRHGADIHTRDRDNQTLLHCAINHCKSEIVRYLLQTPFFVEEVKHNQPASTRNYTSARQTNNNFMQSAMQIYGMDHWHINDKARTSIIRQLIVANTLCPAYVGDKAKDTLTQLATMYPDIQAQIKKLISG